MKTYQGKGAYGAIAIGIATKYKRENAFSPCLILSDQVYELQRLEAAKTLAASQLRDIREKAERETDKSLAQIFEAHELLLQDEEFTTQMQRMIRETSCNAEYAVETVSKDISEAFSAFGDPLFMDRATDVTDVADRLLSCLKALSQPSVPQLQSASSAATAQASDASSAATTRVPGIILCADDLTPSETMTMDKNAILAFVTASGSLTSHVAILAKGRQIPAIVGVGDEFLKDLQDGTKVIVDGFTGTLYVDPDRETEQILLNKQIASLQEKEQFLKFKGLESKTLGGTTIEIAANISSVEELNAVLDNDADAIGLFRSEFLYLGREEEPSEEQQFQAYREALERMAGKRVIIRTLDVGADKQVDYLPLGKEENPALGLRAIRLCLKNEILLKKQLRALYRASVYGKLGILFPMIASVTEVQKILTICGEVRENLRQEGIPFDEKTELGIMIETPAAALISDLLAPLVDFFSVGTNDLTQYTLAIDRQNEALEPFLDPRHEAVLRLIGMAAENARKNGIWIGICGELASDPTLTESFLRIGITELSVSPAMVLPLRGIVRSIN